MWILDSISEYCKKMYLFSAINFNVIAIIFIIVIVNMIFKHILKFINIKKLTK